MSGNANLKFLDCWTIKVCLPNRHYLCHYLPFIMSLLFKIITYRLPLIFTILYSPFHIESYLFGRPRNFKYIFRTLYTDILLFFAFILLFLNYSLLFIRTFIVFESRKIYIHYAEKITYFNRFYW